MLPKRSFLMNPVYARSGSGSGIDVFSVLKYYLNCFKAKLNCLSADSKLWLLSL